MYTFFSNFMRRGFAATFSYHSWQVPASRFRHLCDATLFLIFFFLTVGLFI